jgi:hypothetical protein
MAKLVLFGGGDGGGLIITEHGVRPIPPFDPLVRSQIKAVSQLMAAIKDQGNGISDHNELSALTTRLSNLAIQQVEAIIGTLDNEASLIVLNGDDEGFVCGTTGKVPVPLPSPPKELPALSSILARGGIDRSLLTFVEKATEQGRSVEDILERPADVARELGVVLSERSVRYLHGECSRADPSVSDGVGLDRQRQREVIRPGMVGASGRRHPSTAALHDPCRGGIHGRRPWWKQRQADVALCRVRRRRGAAWLLGRRHRGKQPGDSGEDVR